MFIRRPTVFAPASVNGVELQQVRGTGRVAGCFIDVDEAKITPPEGRPETQATHPPEAIDSDTGGHGGPLISSSYAHRATLRRLGIVARVFRSALNGCVSRVPEATASSARTTQSGRPGLMR